VALWGRKRKKYCSYPSRNSPSCGTLGPKAKEILFLTVAKPPPLWHLGAENERNIVPNCRETAPPCGTLEPKTKEILFLAVAKPPPPCGTLGPKTKEILFLSAAK